MKVMVKLYFLVITLFSLVACNHQNEKNETDRSVNWTSDHSTRFAQEISKEEERDILVYLKTRSNWEMQQSETGLRYWIYEETENTQVEPGQIIKVSFEVKLLNGELCYNTEEGESSTFMVDKSDIETGVQEVVKYMREGERAKVIIPSHLGHGLLGDFDKIPPLQPLVIDLHIKEIINK